MRGLKMLLVSVTMMATTQIAWAEDEDLFLDESQIYEEERLDQAWSEEAAIDLAVPIRGREVLCRAENQRGEIFRATGPTARIARDRALRVCYSYHSSLRCRPLSCLAR